MRFDLSQSGLKSVITAGIFSLVAIGILFNWAVPVSAQNAAPAKPDAPTLRALHQGMVEVDWNDVSGANRYEVQFYTSSGWIDLPNAGLGIEIFFDGSRAVATGLPEDLGYDAFHVRAGNSVGWSEWSEYAWQMTTHNMDWEDIPVPTIEPTPEPVNTPATGAPTISGTVQVGETLTADASGIADADGLTGATFAYQWLADDAEIAGATGSTYVLTSSEVDKAIKLRVSFTDYGGNDEILTSAATGAVSPVVQQQQASNTPATGAPTISGTGQVGETLTADTSGIADTDGLTNATYSYQWIANDGTTDTDITGATDSSSYTLVAADEGQTIKVRVSFMDEAANEESLTSEATAEVVAAGPPSHITVAVTEDASDPNNIVTNFTVTWSDADNCSTNYNAYLIINRGTQPGHETPESQLDLGSAPSDGAQIAKGLSVVQGSFQRINVELYCGTDGSGRLVSRVRIPRADTRPKPGTYSSEPRLIALSVSHGTLIPTFNSYTYRYAVPDVGNADTRITITATPKTGYYVDFFEASEDGFVFGLSVGIDRLHGLSAECKRQRGYSDGGGPLVELTDAGPDTPGFQVDLYDGDNYVHVRVHSIANCDLGTGYSLPITRAEGSLSSPRPNRPPTGLPTISPRYDRGPYVGLTMIADASKIRDRDGRTNAIFSYQWLADDAEITGATGSSYTVADTDLGKTLKVRGSFPDDRGTEESVTSVATGVVKLRNFGPSGKPIIVGFLRVGQTLRADVSGIRDSNGLTKATFRYEWGNFRGPVTDGEEYTLVDNDAGGSNKWLRVYYTDDAGHEEKVSGDYIGVVAPRSDSAATGAPTISGTAQVGETLMADTTSIADTDGLANVSYGYQWIRNDRTSGRAITSARDSTYTLVAADEGKTIKVNVSFTDDAGNGETRTSAATSSVAARPNSPGTGAPTISGTVQVGETLTADTSGIAGTGGLMIGYQWVANDGTSDTEIRGARYRSYTLVAADEGKTINVKVSLTDDAGNTETLTSTATSLVAARPNSAATGAPTITGNVHVRERLTADTSGIADADGLTNVTYSYQWIANDGTSDTDITGATRSTYTLAAADEGKTIKVRVSFTDGAANEESLTSEATAEVAAAGQPGHITVVVTEDTSDPNNIVTNFTVTWSDADNCSTNYNAYLIINRGTQPGHETPESQLDLGSAAFDGAQITKGLSDVPGSVDRGGEVELYCGTDGSGRLVSGVGIPYALALSGALRPKPGTYSSEPPLIALSVSQGTLTPTFDRRTYGYAVPDVDNADTRITITATPETGYYVDFYEGSADPGTEGRVSSEGDRLHGLSAECERSRGYTDHFGPLIKLTDADADMPGFQVDLYDGDSHVHVRVHSIAHCDLGTRYILAITRAEGSVSSPLPNRPPTGLLIIGPDEDAELRGMFGDMSQGGLYNGPQVGQTIDAIVWLIRDRDGLVTGNFSPDGTGSSHLGPFLISEALSFQWLADDAEITGATSSYYTVPDTDLGKTLKVRVSFTDDRGTEESVTSVATGVVKLRNFVPTGKPIIVGTLEVGQTLRADVSGIRDPNGMTNSTFGYVWHGFGGPVRDGEEYTLVDSDAGRSGWVDVTYTDDAGHEATLHSATTGVVVVRPNSPATGAPNITGTAQVGETLTADASGVADTDGLTNVSYGYQWIANDGTSDTDITGATDSTYTLVSDDEGKTLKVRVTFTDDAGNGETLTSTATEAVSFAVQQQTANTPATGAPTIRGTVQVGETLTAYTAGITDDDGLNNVSYGYQWIRNDGTSDTEIQDATGETYPLVDADEGQTIKVKVSFTDDADNEEALTSTATAEVAAAAPTEPPGRPRNLTGAANADGTVTLSWDAPNDDAVTGYQILRRKPSEGEKTLLVHVNDTGSTATQHTDRDVTPDVGHAYRVKAINAVGLSRWSNFVNVTPVQPAEPAQNSPATGRPTISGTAQVGETLTANTSGIADDDGLINVSYSHQWIRNDGTSDTDITDATRSSYTLVDADEGQTLQVRVSFTDDVGNDETLTSAATGEVEALPNRPATGTPSISGTAQVGETLTVDTSGIADADGLTNVSYSYQWVAGGTDLGGATGSTYTLTASEQGQTIQVRVSFTDDAGNETTLTSAATEAVAAKPNSLATGEPTISGPARVGETLTVDTSGIADADGLENATFSYQWVRNDGSSDTDIAGATDSGYMLVAGDVGQTIQVRVSFTDDAGNEEALTSTATEAVAARPNTSATGRPSISGTVRVGEVLTADTSGIADDDGLTNVSYGYQWVAGGTDLGGATGSTYTLTASEQGKTIRVRVSFTDDASNQESLTSAATEAVAAKPNSPATGQPIISGTVRVGDMLTADTSGIADADGLDNVSYRYQWVVTDRGAYFDISGETGATYTLVDADEGQTLKVRVSFTDDVGHDETLTSASTAAIAAEDPQSQEPPAKPTGLTATVSHDSVSLTWDDPGDESITGYQILRRDRALHAIGEFLVHVDDTGNANTTFTDNDVEPSVQYVYRIKAKNNAGLSELSEWVRANMPAPTRDPNSPATGVPTVTGTAQVGEVLTADTSGIADADGLENATFSYQWIRNDGSTETDIQDATGSIYTLVDADEGQTIKVKVSFTDDAGNEETLTSTATGSVAARPNTSATGRPTISGTVRVGEVLTADTTGIADDDGLTNVSYGYQWVAGGTDLGGATGSTYTLTASEQGQTIQVRVSFTDDAGNETTLTSAATEAVAAKPNSLATGEPSISGTVRVGETLTVDTSGIADADGLENARFSYQWIRNDGSSDTDITGATDTSYTLVADDVGQTIKVRVSFSDDAGNETTLTSAATEAVAARPNTSATGRPTISGTVRVGEVLTADTSGIADDDGLTNVSYGYQWVVTDRGAYFDISGETGATYTLVSADRGLYIQVRVSFTDDAGNRETLTSAMTDVVAAAP